MMSEVAEKPANSSQTATEAETLESCEQLDLEEEEICFQDIDMLIDQGVSINDIKCLKDIGINTIKGLQMTVRKILRSLKGFDEAKIDKIMEACCKVSVNSGFVTALEVMDQRKEIFKLQTGSSNLDNLLGGGIESMAITEVFGEFGTGKTQLSHTLCVTAQIPDSNGYLGAHKHSRPHRLKPIAERFNLDPTSVLENVLYARAYTSEHQYQLLGNIGAKLHEEPGIFKLLIVDSVMALFRVDFSGRAELAERQQKLGRTMSKLQKLSEEFGVAVLVTNQITSDLGEAEAAKPVGGNVLAHSSTTRVALKKGKGNRRVASVYDSPDLEESEASFAITKGGIDDPEH
ncbi:unnamed protein product [Phyllotreta striolata]|uniref:Uncharacterized protein n=1 Tax=Phyllotreta striolata TaxID=444603 RepID=A0A9N9TWT2_PHYSR|nr:unnamed protein product [Phyllotreta striolata]